MIDFNEASWCEHVGELGCTGEFAEKRVRYPTNVHEWLIRITIHDGPLSYVAKSNPAAGAAMAAIGQAAGGYSELRQSLGD